MKLNRLLFLAVLLPLSAWGNAGEFRFVQGDVRILHSDGNTDAAHRGSKVAEGDTIITGSAGYAQLTMADEAVIAVRPDTRLKLEVYRYDGKQDGNEKGLLGLLRGGFRTITGWIGRSNKDAYAVKTPTATIGIRGTDHEPLYIPPPVAGEIVPGEPGTYDKVNSGSTFIETEGGRIEVGPNQVGFAAAAFGAVPQLRSTLPVRSENSGGASRTQGGQAVDQQGNQTQANSDAPASESSTNTSTTTTGSLAGALATVPEPTVAPLPQTGTIDPRYITSGTYAAPTGFVVAGGDLSPGVGLGNGAGFVGNSQEGMAILLDSAGNPLTVGTNGGFNFDRNGAPLVDSGSDTIGGKTVNWGVYAGGIISDRQGIRYPQYFFFMGGGEATTPTNLLAALPSPGNTLTFETVGGYTKPITESGAIGGSVNNVVIGLKNISGAISVYQYGIDVTDAQGRNWTASMPNPQLLSSFVTGGGANSNLITSCSGCQQSTGSGDARGMVAGNPAPAGVISSYTLKAGTAGVAGAVLAK